MWFMVDVEAHLNSPCPNFPSSSFGMTEFAAVAITKPPYDCFWGRILPRNPTKQKPIAKDILLHLSEGDMAFVMKDFVDWLQSKSFLHSFMSDNPAYDWQWINYELWKNVGNNPFGHSATNLGSLYKGFVGKMNKNFKHLRKTKHTHNPVDDCIGNIEALFSMVNDGLVINLEKGII